MNYKLENKYIKTPLRPDLLNVQQHRNLQLLAPIHPRL